MDGGGDSRGFMHNDRRRQRAVHLERRGEKPVCANRGAGARRVAALRPRIEFSPENLYEQIDGRAEFFLAYDVVRLTFASFESSGDTRRSLNLSVYDMGTPVNAFGVFSAERSPGEAPVDLGRAAYHSGPNVYVWKGQYYVQVIASPAADELLPLALDLARQTARLLPDSDEPVWGLKALPHNDLIPDSVRYFQVDALGLDFMRNTYTAEYRKDDAVVAVFLSRYESAEAVRAAMDRYATYAEKYGKGAERLTADGRQFLVCDMGAAFDVVFQKGRLFGGVTAAKERAKAIEAAEWLGSQLTEQ